MKNVLERLFDSEVKNVKAITRHSRLGEDTPHGEVDIRRGEKVARRDMMVESQGAMGKIVQSQRVLIAADSLVVFAFGAIGG